MSSLVFKSGRLYHMTFQKSQEWVLEAWYRIGKQYFFKILAASDQGFFGDDPSISFDLNVLKKHSWHRITTRDLPLYMYLPYKFSRFKQLLSEGAYGIQN